MSVLCIFKVVTSFSELYKLRELFPLIQFIALSYIWTWTNFYKTYPTLVAFSLSIVFYLLNGKMVVAFLTKKPMKLFHLEIFYFLIPVGIILAEKYQFITTKQADDMQIRAGFLILGLHVERMITYTIMVTNRVSNYLGIGFFEIPKKKEN